MGRPLLRHHVNVTDEYSLPDLLFGPLPDWFFPAVGRVVAVSSLLEHKAQVLAETLMNVPQDTLTMKPPAEMWKLARKAANQVDSANTALGVAPVSKDVESFFGQVLDLLERRNGVVHGIWPAQAGAEQFGWRPRRLGRDVETRITADKTRADMTDLIGRAAHLIQSWTNLHGAVNYAQTRAAEGGYKGLPVDSTHQAGGDKQDG